MKNVAVFATIRFAWPLFALGGLTAVLFLIASPRSAAAQGGANTDIVLSGRVLADSGADLEVVQLRVDELGATIFQKLIELSNDGTFTVHLGTLHSKQIQCTLSAPGFDLQRITGLTNGVAPISVGLIRLKSFVELGPVTVSTAVGNYSIIDFWITSHVARPLTFVRVSISALQSATGPCFDSDPIVTMRFSMSGQHPVPSGQEVATILHIDSDGTNGPRNQPTLLVNGEVERDSCGPLMLRLTAPYSFALTAEDQSKPRKIRLEVPLAITVGKFGTVHPDWDQAIVTAEMDTQEKISGSPK